MHHHAIRQAERFGGSFLYFCPMGMTHWASPVRISGLTVAALIGGPVLMVGHDDYLQEDFSRFKDLDADGRTALRRAVSEIPFADTKKTRSLASLLSLAARSVAADLSGFPLGEAPAESPGDPYGRYAAPAEPKSFVRYPIVLERELLRRISVGDLEGSREALNEVLGFIFFHSEHDIEAIKLRVEELVVLLSRAAIEGGAPVADSLALNDLYLPWIRSTRSVYDLSAALAVLLSRFIEFVFALKSVKHAGLVQRAIRYLNANYRKPISLEDVAFHVGLSPSHFSRMFREGTGETYVSFLSELRVKAAKKLLEDLSIPLSEVGPMVGFEDQSYFTRIFKKRTGMAPGRYRKRKGLAEGSPVVDESDIEIHE